MRKRAETDDAQWWAREPAKEMLLAGDPLWELALRVVASRGFRRSQLLSSFLLHICERQILGLHGELTEQQVGERVFRRGAGYSPGEDNIVRTYARLLRQRLAAYFATEGAAEPLHLVVPRGAYVPVLAEAGGAAALMQKDLNEASPGPTEVEKAEATNGAESEEAEPPERPMEMPRVVNRDRDQGLSRPFWVGAMVVALLCLGLLVMRERRAPAGAATSADRFWGEMFVAGRDTIVIPGDDGLVLYEDLTHSRVTLNDYVSGEYLRAGVRGVPLGPMVAPQLGIRRYTSFVDLQIVSQVAQLAASKRGRFRIRYAREANLDDLQRANVILLGSLHANPWTELFQQGLDFQFETEAGREDLVVHNVHARRGEQAIYKTDSDDAHTTYGLLAFRRSIDGTGHVLLLEGINMAGTQAAAEVLLNGTGLAAIAGVDQSGDGDWPAFEVLVQTGNFGANAVRSQIVAVHVH